MSATALLDTIYEANIFSSKPALPQRPFGALSRPGALREIFLEGETLSTIPTLMECRSAFRTPLRSCRSSPTAPLHLAASYSVTSRVRTDEITVDMTQPWTQTYSVAMLLMVQIVRLRPYTVRFKAETDSSWCVQNLHGASAKTIYTDSLDNLHFA